MSEDSLLERVTAVAEERHLSQNTLTAYRRTWLKLIAWSAAEGVVLETLPSERAGEFYEETTQGRSASHHLQVKAALALLYDVRVLQIRSQNGQLQVRARENEAALSHCLTIGTASTRVARGSP
jgi:site-specific recombinase XerD